MVFGAVLNLATTLSLSCHYNPQQCANGTTPSFPPPVIQYGHQNQTLMLNDVAILPCQANGRVTPSVSWFRDGTPLNLSVVGGGGEEESTVQRFRQLSTGTLQISDLRKSDTGVYTCRAKNEDGEASWTASLTVEEHTNRNTMFQRMPDATAFPLSPGKPMLINATEDSVELEWTSPERHGASPIIGYILQYWSPEMEESWQNVMDVIPGTRFRVRNLLPNHSYAFVVRAENSKGIGPPSAISELITTKSPNGGSEKDRIHEQMDLESARQRLASEQLIKLQEVRALNSTAMLLKWKRQRREPLVQGYYIKWRGPPLYPDHSWVNVTENAAEIGDQSVVINGLRPFNVYEFFVIPYHQSVQGMPSNSMEGTTHEAPPSQPPSDVRMRMLNLTSLKVSWRPPPADSINGILKGFLLNIRSNSSEERNITTNERATSVTLYRLIPDASYAIRLSARTNAGWGAIYEGQSVVMNEETLTAHVLLAEARHVDAWYKQPWSVLIIGIILWFILILMIILLWYRCCYRRRQKSVSADQKEFIKIRDGSVANSTAQQFWASHDQFANGTAAGTGETFTGVSGMGNSSHCMMMGCHGEPMDCCQYSDYGGSSAGGAGTLPHHHHSHGHLHHAQAYYHQHPNNNECCAVAYNPANCSTMHRQCSESPHHYHYAQLPDIRESCGGGLPCNGHNNENGMSSFYDHQQSARQLNEYYDDPSPYATTTLVMSSAHTPRAHRPHGGGTLRSSSSHHPHRGPALPVNPIPREPPRNFLATAAVAASQGLEQSSQMTDGLPYQCRTSSTICCPLDQHHHSASFCCGNNSSSCGALLEEAQPAGANRRSTAGKHQPNPNEQNCYFSHTQHPSTSHRSSRNHHTHHRTQPRADKYPQAFSTVAGSSGRGVKHGRSSSVSTAEHSNAKGRKAVGVISTKVTMRSPSLLQQQEDSPHTDVSYVQSSDGTNGSSKAARALGENLMELIPSPDIPPSGDECGNDYDPVAEAFSGGRARGSQNRRNSRSELGRHSRHPNKQRISLLEDDPNGLPELNPLMRSYDIEADGEMSDEESRQFHNRGQNNESSGYCGYSPSPAASANRPTRQPLMGTHVSALSLSQNQAQYEPKLNSNNNSSDERTRRESSSKFNTQVTAAAYMPSSSAKHDFV